jgi:hypothetical protein
MVLKLCREVVGSRVSSSSNSISFKDVVKIKPSPSILIHFPNVYILDKLKEVSILEVKEEVFLDIL